MKTLNYTPDFWDTSHGAFIFGGILGLVGCALIAGLALVIAPEAILSLF